MHKIELTYNKEQVANVVNIILKHLKPSSVIFLHGEIGVGKTFLVGHLLKSLGVNETITSPTFSIFNEYDSAIGKVFHYDLYRIKRPEELLFVDLEDNQSQGCLIIEWPDFARSFGINPTIEIFIEYTDGDYRNVKITQ